MEKRTRTVRGFAKLAIMSMLLMLLSFGCAHHHGGGPPAKTPSHTSHEGDVDEAATVVKAEAEKQKQSRPDNSWMLPKNARTGEVYYLPPADKAKADAMVDSIYSDPTVADDVNAVVTNFFESANGRGLSTLEREARIRSYVKGIPPEDLDDVYDELKFTRRHSSDRSTRDAARVAMALIKKEQRENEVHFKELGKTERSKHRMLAQQHKAGEKTKQKAVDGITKVLVTLIKVVGD